MNPLISIIVPNYNHAAFLKQRLESVFNQTYQNFEVILLDDCSTDASVEILMEYAKNPKVSHFIVNKKNSGNTFIQWEKGIVLAAGEFIWIAESDDFCELNFLEELISPLRNNINAVLSYCQSFRVNEEGISKGDWFNHTENFDARLFKTNFCMYGNIFTERFLIYKNVIPNASAVLFRRDEYIEKSILLPQAHIKHKYCGDWLLYMQLLINKEVCYTPKLLNYFRYHTQSVIAGMITTTNIVNIANIELAARKQIKVISTTFKPFNNIKILTKNEELETKLFFDKALYYFKNNNKIKGAGFLLWGFNQRFKKFYLKAFYKKVLIKFKLVSKLFG